jgi:hypothetical protein
MRNSDIDVAFILFGIFRAKTPSGIQHPASASGIQHLAFSIQHSAFSIQHSAFSIQHSAFSIQHSASSIQHPASKHPASIHPSNMKPEASLSQRDEISGAPALSKSRSLSWHLPNC